MSHETLILTTVVASVAFGLTAQVLAHRWRIPAIVILLLSGVLLGPSGIGLIRPDALGGGLGILVKMAVAVVLFDGALNLRLAAIKNSAMEIRNLVTVGALITWILVAFAARFIAQLSWELAILFGALMTVTGPTVVQPLLKRLNVSKEIKAILEGEAILIDPVGAILAVAVLDAILASFSTDHTLGTFAILWGYVGRLITGVVVGWAGAAFLSKIMKTPRLIPSEIANLVALAVVWASFGISEYLQSESGIMASVAMGLLLQRESIPAERQLRQFKESLTILSVSILFILLAANLNLNNLLREGWRGALTVLVIMVVIRPLNVFLSLRKSKLQWREKLFIAWIGPRGIVAASAASLFAVTLQGSPLTDQEHILSLTFLVIMMTVTIQGLTADWVSRALKVNVMVGKKTLIVGASPMSAKIAELLAQNGRPVTILDTNRAAAANLKRLGFDSQQGNALDESALERAGIEETETLLALTSNAEVNALIAQLAHFEYGVARAYPSLKDPAKGIGEQALAQLGGKLAFGRAVDLAQWEREMDKVQTLEVHAPQTWTPAPAREVNLPAEILPVIRKRKGNVTVVHADDLWQPEDAVIFLTRLPLDQTRQILSAQGFHAQGFHNETSSL